MRKIRLFTSGTHNGDTFSNDDIKEIFALTQAGIDKIPVVLGHPKNDLPVVGWVNKNKILLYQEGDKYSIGFERKDAEFSEEAISAIKELKRDKISVRLTDMAITHIGLVKKAAVAENNDQTFSDENKTGTFCFSEDFPVEIEDTESIEDIIVRKFNQFFNHKSNNYMTPEDKLKAENEALKAKLAEFEAAHNQSAVEKENLALKAKLADFEQKGKEIKKTALTEKVNGSKLEDAKKQETIEFGEKLLEKDEVLFDSWLNQLSLEAKVVPQNGNVLNGGKAAEFSEEKADAGEHYSAKVNELLTK